MVWIWVESTVGTNTKPINLRRNPDSYLALQPQNWTWTWTWTWLLIGTKTKAQDQRFHMGKSGRHPGDNPIVLSGSYFGVKQSIMQTQLQIEAFTPFNYGGIQVVRHSLSPICPGSLDWYLTVYASGFLFYVYMHFSPRICWGSIPCQSDIYYVLLPPRLLKKQKGN